jgi:hypothetical protein
VTAPGSARHAARWLAAGIARTWRVEVEGERGLAALRRARAPVLFAVWHGQLLAPLWHRRRQGITLLVSGHRDAAVLAEAAQRWGYRVVRGSSTRGRVRGLMGLMRSLAGGGVAAVAPDGPRGPSGIVKAGAVAAAQRVGAAIVPVAACASRGVRLGSWDGFTIPLPLSRVRIVYGQPLRVDPGTDGLARGREELQLALERATEAARC